MQIDGAERRGAALAALAPPVHVTRCAQQAAAHRLAHPKASEYVGAMGKTPGDGAVDALLVGHSERHEDAA